MNVAAVAEPAARGPAPSPTLADLPRGGKGTISELEGRDVVVQRLLEMGLTQGAVVEVVRFAPLGDPIEVRVLGYLLSLRREDARCVRVAAT